MCILPYFPPKNYIHIQLALIFLHAVWITFFITFNEQTFIGICKHLMQNGHMEHICKMFTVIIISFVFPPVSVTKA